MDGESFSLERRTCGLTVEACADLLQVSSRTVRYWEKGQVRVPYSAFKLMRILRNQEIPHPNWKGWRWSADAVWNPAGQRFDRAGLEYLWLVFSGYRAWLRARGISPMKTACLP